MSSVLRLCAIALLLFAATAQAERVDVRRDDNTTDGRGLVIDGLAISTARWTGWIEMKTDESMVFDIDFVDANSSVTAVTMVCETSRSSSTANDAGRDLHVLSISAGTATSTPMTWSYTSGGSKSWTWTVANVPAKWLNCKFYYSGGTPAAADLITVYARSMTP